MRSALLICAMVLALPAQAAKDYGNVVVSKVGTVYDGDTFKVDINHWPPIIGKAISVRFHDIDAPEMRGKCEQEKKLARMAKQYLVQRLRSAKMVELRNITRDKYFRIDADVYLDGKKFKINSENKRFFKTYANRGGWCS